MPRTNHVDSKRRPQKKPMPWHKTLHSSQATSTETYKHSQVKIRENRYVQPPHTRIHTSYNPTSRARLRWKSRTSKDHVKKQILIRSTLPPATPSCTKMTYYLRNKDISHDHIAQLIYRVSKGFQIYQKRACTRSTKRFAHIWRRMLISYCCYTSFQSPTLKAQTLYYTQFFKKKKKKKQPSPHSNKFPKHRLSLPMLVRKSRQKRRENGHLNIAFLD